MKDRLDWTAQVAQLTEPHRFRRARALETRGSQLALARRRAFRLDGFAGRTARGKPEGGHQEGDDGRSRAVLNRSDEDWATREKPEREARAKLETPWHSARAETKRRLFEKVAECGEGHTLELVCRSGSCGERFTVPLGCGQAFFCPKCRARRATAFRVDFQRKQLGLVGIASRAGLLHRYRKRKVGGRFGERLLTLTVPHLSEDGEPLGVAQRIYDLRNTWDRFNRLWRDELRGKLRGLKSGITIQNSQVGLPVPRGKAKPSDELSLFELVSSLRVFEWTPGEDGKGHPHFHVWIFSPFLDVHWLRSLWSRAYADVVQPKRVCQLLVVDVRSNQDCQSGIAHELVKYLTKDWHLTGDKAKRVAPEVFAELYSIVDGTRTRQSSQGLAHWAVAKDKSCPCCAFSSERGHWARVFVNHDVQEQANMRSTGPLEYPDVPAVGVAPRTRSGELQEIYNGKQDAAWRSSADRRLLARRLGIKTAHEAVVLPCRQVKLPL